jgi:hypothetical protein
MDADMFQTQKFQKRTARSGAGSSHASFLTDNRAQPVQRKIDAAGLMKEEKSDSSLSAIIQRKVHYAEKLLPKALKKTLIQEIQQYNGYSLSKSNMKIALHKQFEMLHNIENSVNTYLRVNTTSIPENERLELFRVLRQTENDHIKLTGRLAQHGHDIWLGNTNLSHKKQQQTQRLWHSLRQSQGNVKIDTTNKDFKNQVLSGYVHLLGGDHGRGMLRELNKFHPGVGHHPDPGKHIHISDNFLPRFQGIGKQGEHAAGSWAYGIGQVHHNNTHHQNGTGTGSYVQVQHSTPQKTGDYETDVKGKPLHSPKFITLGHELGHARHNLRGTAGYLRDWNDLDPRNPLHGPGAQVARAQWTGSEEFQNITHQENQIRREQGLPVRKFHATKNAQVAHKNRIELTNLFETQVARVPQEPRYLAIRQQLGAFSHRLQVSTDMANPQQVGALRRDLNTFRANLPALKRAARQQHEANQRALRHQQRIATIRSYLPSKRQLLTGALIAGGAGLYGYYKGWFGT